MRLRRDDFLAEAALLAALDQPAQAGFGIRGHHAQEAVQIAVVEDVAFAHQRDVIVQDVGGARHGLRRRLRFPEQSLSRRVRTFRPPSISRIFSSRVPNRDSMPRLICTLDFIRGETRVWVSKPEIRGRGGRNHICLHNTRKRIARHIMP